MTEPTKNPRFLPRHKSVKKAFPNVCPHERTMEQRIDDEKALRRAINTAQSKKRLSPLQSAAMLQLVEEGDWETGIVEWSNAKWCELLGLKNPKRKRERENGQSWVDQSPFALRKLFKGLISRRLLDREELKARDSTVLVEGSPAWQHGMWITRRTVWDALSFVAALDGFALGTAPDLQRSGAPPIPGDRGPP